jgi:hypothetical protein
MWSAGVPPSFPRSWIRIHPCYKRYSWLLCLSSKNESTFLANIGFWICWFDGTTPKMFKNPKSSYSSFWDKYRMTVAANSLALHLRVAPGGHKSCDVRHPSNCSCFLCQLSEMSQTMPCWIDFWTSHHSWNLMDDVMIHTHQVPTCQWHSKNRGGKWLDRWVGLCVWVCVLALFLLCVQ